MTQRDIGNYWIGKLLEARFVSYAEVDRVVSQFYAFKGKEQGSKQFWLDTKLVIEKKPKLENCQWLNTCIEVMEWSDEVAGKKGWAGNHLPDPFEGFVRPLLEGELYEEVRLWRRAVLLERELRSNEEAARLLACREYARAMLHVLSGAGSAESLAADLHRVTFTPGQVDQLLLSAGAEFRAVEEQGTEEDKEKLLHRALVVLHGDKEGFAVERFAQVFGQQPIRFDPEYRLGQCRERGRCGSSGLGKWTDHEQLRHCPPASESADDTMTDVDEPQPLPQPLFIVHDTHWGSFFSMAGGKTINFKGGKGYPFYNEKVPSGLVFFGAAPTSPDLPSRFGHVRLRTTLDKAVDSFAKYWNTTASSVRFYMLSTRVYYTFRRWTALVTTRNTAQLGDAISKACVVAIANSAADAGAAVDFAFDLGLHHDGYTTRPFSGSWSVDDIELIRVEHSDCTSYNYAKRGDSVNDAAIVDTHERSIVLDAMMKHWFPVPKNETAKTSTDTAGAQS